MKAEKRQKFANALKHTRRFRELRGRREGSQSSPGSCGNNKENHRHGEDRFPVKALFVEDAASPTMSMCSSSSSPNCVVSSLDTEQQQQQQQERCSVAPPRVSMSETGAEVTLQDDASSASPSRLSSLRHVSGSTSLLDEAASPPRAPLQPVLAEESEKPLFSSPSLVMSRTSSLLTASFHTSPSKTPNSMNASPMGLFPCGGGELECCSRVVAYNAGDVEWQIITQFLESPEHTHNWCHGWQAWSYFQLRRQQQQSGIDVIEEGQDPVSQETVQRILRHRVTDLAVRRDRLATLRRDLCPFEEEDNPGVLLLQQHQKQRPLARVSSLQPSSKSADRTSRSRRDGTTTTSSSSLSQPPMWGCGTFDFATLQDELPPSPGTVEIGYDSDPEDFCQRRRHSKSTLSPKGQQQLRPLAEILQDEDAVREAVQRFMNGKMIFILHQHGNQLCSSSHAVTAWIEPGQNLSKQAIGPRFMWKAQQQQHTKKNQCHSIDLLDVHRVLPVTKHLDRSRYPLAKAKHCLWIKTVQTSLLLEASSTSERDRIAWGLKLTISRLAMKVICSDPSMADEFFLKPTEDYLEPGNEPEWLMN